MASSFSYINKNLLILSNIASHEKQIVCKEGRELKGIWFAKQNFTVEAKGGSKLD